MPKAQLCEYFVAFRKDLPCLTMSLRRTLGVQSVPLQSSIGTVELSTGGLLPSISALHLHPSHRFLSLPRNSPVLDVPARYLLPRRLQSRASPVKTEQFGLQIYPAGKGCR